MREYAPEASFASWAFRFAASQEGVARVLSGMNTVEQVMDNTATFRDFRPITEEELGIIRQGLFLLHPRMSEGDCHPGVFCAVQQHIPDHRQLFQPCGLL